MNLLLVEDDIQSAAKLETELKEWGVDVRSCTSVACALQHLDGDMEFDAVVTDENIPSINGIGTVDLLSQAFGKPIVVLSGDACTESTRPFDPKKRGIDALIRLLACLQTSEAVIGEPSPELVQKLAAKWLR